jgi:hypothetical protein
MTCEPAFNDLTNARTFLERVLPWPPLGDANAYFNIHYPVVNLKGGKPFWKGYAIQNVDEALRQIRWILASNRAIGDVYVCMSSQRLAETRTTASGKTFRIAQRSQQAAVELRSLFLDIDVKPGAYHTTQDAMRALAEFCKASGMPRPTLAVQSGSGGLHIYWCLDEALTPARWKPLADALAEATRRYGLVCDTVCTVDSARILRVPDTFNFKSAPPRPVTLALQPGADYPVGVIVNAIGSKMLPEPSLAPGGTSTATLNAADVIGMPAARPLVLATARDECAWIAEALDTGGAGFKEPLWHLSVLAATFDAGGLATAHALSQGHPGYTQANTAALYERKLKEREIKNLGWPSCQAIKDAGCSHCATCLHLAAGKSPLNLAKRQVHNQLSTPTAERLRALPLHDLPLKPPPRRWMHGTDLLRGVCTLVVSPGGKGKTATLIAFALACASGRPIIGAKVFGGPQRVLYINTEDGVEEVGRRTRAALTYHGLTNEDCPGLRLAGVDTARLTLLHSVRGDHRIDADQWGRLRALISEHRPDLIVLDPLANLSTHTLNDNAAATALMAGLTSLAVEFDAAILIAHHTGKGRDLTSQEAAMGASALVNSARVVLSIDTLSAADADKIGVMPSDAPRYFRLISVKGNLTKPSADDRWHELTSVALGNGTPEYPSGDNVQVVTPFRPRPGNAALPAQQLAAVLNAIASASPPLSPKKQAGDRYAVPAVARAIGAIGPGGELDAKAVLKTLLDQDLVREEPVKVPRGGGRGANERLGLVVTDAGRSRLGVVASSPPSPQSPQSAVSPIEEEQGAARLVPRTTPQSPRGGMGESERIAEIEAAETTNT